MVKLIKFNHFTKFVEIYFTIIFISLKNNLFVIIKTDTILA